MKANNHLKIYKEYITRSKKTSIEQLAKKHGITKAGLYYIVNRIEKGDASKIARCTENSRQMCLWEYKYKNRYNSIPKGRNALSVELLKVLIKEMRNDKFSLPLTAKLLNRDRTTIIHHLK